LLDGAGAFDGPLNDRPFPAVVRLPLNGLP
jgi:hypothetical protein